MRKLEEQELEQVTGGVFNGVGVGTVPSAAFQFPNGLLSGAVENQMSGLDVRQSIDPAELGS